MPGICIKAETKKDIVQVTPGTRLKIRVYVNEKSEYFETMYLTAQGADLGECQRDGEARYYYFTMGTDPVTVLIHRGK